MNAQTIITGLAQRGIRLIPNPPKLSVEPASKLTDADRRIIHDRKAELLEFLSLPSERNRWLEGPRPALPLRRCGSFVCQNCQVHGPSPHREDCTFPRFDPCRSRWFWLSPHGAIKCVACSGPTDLTLVEALVLAPETGEDEDGSCIPGEVLVLLRTASSSQ